MAVDFLTQEQRNQYGKFTEEPSEVELAKYFHLDDTDIQLINQRRGSHNRLGIAILLTTVRYLGTFVENIITDVPVNVHVFVAKQLGIKDLSCLNKYASRENTRWEHTSLMGFLT